MSWEDILKKRKIYSEYDLDRLAPYWAQDLLIEMTDLDDFWVDEGDMYVYQDAWHKYTNDENWLKNIKWWKPWFSVSDTEEEVREKTFQHDPDYGKDYTQDSSRYPPVSTMYLDLYKPKEKKRKKHRKSAFTQVD